VDLLPAGASAMVFSLPQLVALAPGGQHGALRTYKDIVWVAQEFLTASPSFLGTFTVHHAVYSIILCMIAALCLTIQCMGTCLCWGQANSALAVQVLHSFGLCG
jgi:hypothetical protein